MIETCPRCGALPCDQTIAPVREAVEIERVDLETRFWSIVDRDGLTGLPSDMWAALETLVSRAAATRTPTPNPQRAKDAGGQG